MQNSVSNLIVWEIPFWPQTRLPPARHRSRSGEAGGSLCSGISGQVNADFLD